MGIFYGESHVFDFSKLSSENTQLAQALKKHDLNFRTWDYTERERELRQRQREVVAELKQEFQAEDNLDIYNDLIEENESNLQLLEAGKKRRYLYYVQHS